MSTTTLEITCAKAGCHWKGPPSDAPTHDCPTPATDVADAFAGIGDAHGEPIPTTNVDEAKRYHVVWSLAEKTVLVGTADDEDAAVKIATLTDAGKGNVEVIDRGPAREALANAIASSEVEKQEVPVGMIAYDADPSSQEDIEGWLLAHGQYDDAGVPLDEKTATLDAQLSAFMGNEDDTLPAISAEPSLDVDVDAEVEALHGEPSAAAAVLAMDDVPADLKAAAADALVAETNAGPRAWETVIAAALAEQTGIKEYRWLVILKPDDETREVELIGRARVKNEATVLAEQVAHESKPAGTLQVFKTSDVLAAAEAIEVERKRKLVEEPDVVVEPEPVEGDEPEPKPDEEEEPETVTDAAARAQAAQPAPPVGKAAPLFNASDYEREDLALPKVDGHSIDRIAVDISGSVMLDRSNPDHVALWRRMKLGSEVELWVTAKGLGFAGKGATNKDGDLDVVVGRRAIAINMLRIIPAEGMQAAADELAAQARDAHETGEDGLEDA